MLHKDVNIEKRGTFYEKKIPFCDSIRSVADWTDSSNDE